ncbi:uncharacterized protein PAC_07074 [Phialocephala subalpina]|uniref:DUF1264 domain protein n=1 Tax=Phialocephala subalpina TaxID=576137 RepID=A0A1L7WWP1_9HELO|nr:uncharacterized protein PAC_07074 [Phialocephala subalpina]
MTSHQTRGAKGPPITTKDKILETGGAMTQSFEPIKAICAHLNAFHVYASDPSRSVEANPDIKQVRSGMLIMPNPYVPNAVWEVAETEEMKEVIGLYGKTFHFWQVDRGDTLPLGLSYPEWNIDPIPYQPQLMMSFTKDEQVSALGSSIPGAKDTDKPQVPWETIKDRDRRYGVDTSHKKEARKGIEGVKIHEDVDSCWKSK